MSMSVIVIANNIGLLSANGELTGISHTEKELTSMFSFYLNVDHFGPSSSKNKLRAKRKK